MKPENIKIISISTIANKTMGSDTVYGLGDDGRVYWWSTFGSEWYLYTK